MQVNTLNVFSDTRSNGSQLYLYQKNFLQFLIDFRFKEFKEWGFFFHPAGIFFIRLFKSPPYNHRISYLRQFAPRIKRSTRSFSFTEQSFTVRGGGKKGGEQAKGKLESGVWGLATPHSTGGELYHNPPLQTKHAAANKDGTVRRLPRCTQTPHG